MNASQSRDAGRPKRLDLRHDFGIVSPGEELSHVFEITNDSSFDWTVKGVTKSCVCTVGRFSSNTVRAGETSKMEVDYKSPKEIADDSASVVVIFKEVHAPSIRATVACRVRKPVSPVPGQVQVGPIGYRKSGYGFFHVENHGVRDWQRLDVESEAEWLTPERAGLVGDEPKQPTQEVEKQKKLDEPRQSWLVNFRVESSLIGPGHYQTAVRVRPQGESEFEEASVLVQMRVDEPLRVAPRQLFFGEVVAGHKHVATLVVLADKGILPNGVSSISVTHDLGDALDLRWLPMGENKWKIEVTLRPAKGAEYLRAKLVLDSPDEAFPTVTIPLTARVASEG